MNRTNEQNNIISEKQERDLLLSEIDKDIFSVEKNGFGRVVIEIKDGRIINWWKVTSRTRRGFFKKMKNIDY